VKDTCKYVKRVVTEGDLPELGEDALDALS